MVDASLRASILDAMLRLRDDHNISFLYITHDLSTAYQIGDQIYMLYQGTTAERGSAMDVIDAPQHPYVQLLIDSVPVPDPTDKWDVNISLPSEEEMRTALSKGCRYYPRCPHRMDKCLVVQPPLFKMDKPKHEAACYLYEDNEIAPIEPPILVNRPITDVVVAVAASRTRERLVAAALVVIAFIVGVLVAANREPETVIENRDRRGHCRGDGNAVRGRARSRRNSADRIIGGGRSAAPEFTLSPEGATAKGALMLNAETVDEIEEDDERHSYTFEATAGQEVTIKLVTGGSGLSGTGFYSPFGTVYGPDGQFVLALGDNPNRPGSQLS